MLDAAVDLYNYLPLVSEVRIETSALAQAQRAASEVIRSGRAGNYAAIVLMHRHFDLDRGIVPVWRVESSELRMQPSIYDSTAHIPVTWRSGSDGIVVPVEFAFGELVPDHVKSTLQSVQFGEFGKRMFAQLRPVDPLTRFGLTVTPSLFSEFFFPGDAKRQAEASFHEVVGGAGEFTRIIPAGLNAGSGVNIVDTIWWMPTGKMRVASGCQCRK
jgi:hypothetical protein